MDNWFSTLAGGSELPPDRTRELHEHGFVVMPESARPRRSLQGAFIPRDGRAGTDFAARSLLTSKRTRHLQA
jgi:hypothetical protein